MPVPDVVPQLNPYGPLISFKSQDILPPSAIYVGPNDSILAQALIPTLTNQVVIVTYRMLLPNGELATTATQFEQQGAAFITDFQFPPQEGFLLSMTLQSSAVSRGQIFVRVFLNVGGSLVITTLAHLFLQGYVSTLDILAFPQSPIAGSLDGRGWLRDLSAGGGAGIVPTIAVPANVHWLLRAARYQLQTDAVAGNRFAALSIIDPTATRTFVQWAPAAIPANTVNILNFAPGAQATSNLSEQTAGAPADLIIPTGWSIAGRVFNQDAGDTTGGIFVTVEEFVGL